MTDALPNHRLPQRNTENARQNHDAAPVEAKIAQKWHEADAFCAGANAKPGAETFTIVIPPPNVTGSFAYAHALNNTLQDIMVRFERMRVSATGGTTCQSQICIDPDLRGGLRKALNPKISTRPSPVLLSS